MIETLLNIFLLILPECIFILYFILYLTKIYNVDFSNKLQVTKIFTILTLMVLTSITLDKILLIWGGLNVLSELFLISFFIKFIIFKTKKISLLKIILLSIEVSILMLIIEGIFVGSAIGLTLGFTKVINTLISMQENILQMFYFSIPARMFEYGLIIFLFFKKNTQEDSK